jgi:hypothetical protein
MQRIVTVLVLIGFVAVSSLYVRNLGKLREQTQAVQQLTQRVNDLMTENRPPSNRPDTVPAPGTDSSMELAELRAKVAGLQTETQRLAQVIAAQSASNEASSNLLAHLLPLASQARTNRVSRTNTFTVQNLKDVGARTLEDAFQTAMFAAANRDLAALQRIAAPGSPIARPTYERSLDMYAPQFQGLSEIILNGQTEFMDGSVELTGNFKYADGSQGGGLMRATLRLRPAGDEFKLVNINFAFSGRGFAQ